VERNGRERREGKGEGKKNGKGKAVTRTRRGGQGEGDNGKGWRRNGGEMKEEKGKCSCDFSSEIPWYGIVLYTIVTP